MSDKELKELISSLGKVTAELAESQKKTDAQMAKTDVQLAKTDKKLEKLAKMVGGISTNNGYFAEEMFASALEDNPVIAGIKFDDVHANVKGLKKKGQGKEYDIVLRNGKYLGLVEVKYRLHPADVKEFAEVSIPQFREYFPQLNDKKIIGAVASTSLSQEVIERAKEYGLAVLTNKGHKVKTISDNIKEY